MDPVCVLEFVRHRDGVWNLPAEPLAALARRVPRANILSPATRAEADERLAEADVVLGFAVRPANFSRADRLRWIHSSAAGVGDMLFPELIASDVVVTNSSGLHADSMAEHTLAVLLAFSRQLDLARDAQRERSWRQDALWTGARGFEDLAGTTLGLVGFGRVGEAIARRARALGLTVLAVRRRPADDPSPAHAQWGPERLHELLARSDWVVLAAPHTAETRGLIGAPELARMRRGARLVNLGRGALVDEPALLAALRAGTIAGAALDVFADEPLAPDSPWWDAPNTIVTPHVSGLAPRYWDRMLEQFECNLVRFIAGEPLENVVDKRAGY